MVTMDQLLDAQTREFPGSVILSRAAVMDKWLLEPKLPGRSRTYSYAAPSIASALLQHPVILFYETANGSRGARYGIEGSEYISGFSQD